MTLGRTLVIAGLAIAALGLVVMLGAKLGLPRLGKLPGDIVWQGKNSTVYFPIVTCVVLSLLITLLMALFNRSR